MTSLRDPSPASSQERVVSSVGALIALTSSRLGSVTEARWIVERVIGRGRSRLAPASSDDRTLPSSVVDEVAGLVERRLAGEPLQYVLGSWAFRGLEVRVDPRVLIPRPETEQVAGFAIDALRDVNHHGSPSSPLVSVDLGTGSGVIALSIAAEAEVPGDGSLEVWATDVSANALDVARSNLSLLAASDPISASRVRFAEGSWFAALPPELAGRVNLLVSNPPYVSRSEWNELDPVVREYEPTTALVAGDAGDEALELLVSVAPSWLAPGGALVLELAPDQAASIAEKARSAGLVQVEIRPDLTGRPRALVARQAQE